MHADEVDIDPDLARRLVASQFPRWADLPLEALRFGGTDNVIYRLGHDKSVRLPRRAPSTGQLEKERRWLPVLAPVLPLAIPVPLAIGEPGEGYPFVWSVYTWLEGELPLVEPIADLRQAAADLAKFVAALQRVDPTDGPPPGPHNAYRGVPLALRDEFTRESIAALGDAIDARAVSDVWEAALRAPDWDRAPVWIHGDLDARNVLVEQGRLSGVIDFGCLGVGDPATDVMVVWKLLSPETRNDFRAALAIDDATWARSRGWAVSQAVTALAYYTLETNAVLVREARLWLAAALADRPAS